jgi:acylphosphatase
MADNLITKRYVVRGRVQGVGFRWFVQREAEALDLSGWVRNTPDGAVEVLASGSEQQLAALEAKLKQGPRAARVDGVEESVAQAPPNLRSFHIEGAW